MEFRMMNCWAVGRPEAQVGSPSLGRQALRRCGRQVHCILITTISVKETIPLVRGFTFISNIIYSCTVIKYLQWDFAGHLRLTKNLDNSLNSLQDLSLDDGHQ